MTITSETLIKLSQNLNKIIVGQPLVIKQLLVAFLSGGHIILEGVPGTGKTLLVKVLSKLIKAEFKRVQLTPDILPSDILGTNIFDLSSRTFTLQKGPIFTEILLADEINRTPPKTQSALLEAMEEQQVTLDGETLVLSPLFWVAATQNPLEFEGTYPLPEAQLDRFLFKLILDYPSLEASKQMLLNFQEGFKGKKIDLEQLEPIATVADILQARQQIQSIKVDDKIIDYILNLVEKTRQHPDLELGVSPRATVAWLQTSKAQAWFSQRDYVTPDDVKNIASPLLRHRLILKPESQLDGIKIDTVITSLLKQVPVPR
ncbi:AAA family ATPase [Aphanothece sacrum]|uniref:MoxR-like ATPase n=1 Tax=Aphanothece sacrum FPU1 TaxID=1920663 RepID=A0A401ICE3_APHSA|nr:MoxR family ATPase [Aphanothece sacrum]GBF78963.1 MoxR-like ATPase [Aphanothece sacrum FPU1]GBF86689.1 MoxR-like ATPase [Aphanothece sacrum FPU3]